MSSLKTGVIIAFGLTVLYGVYLVINKPEPSAEAQAEAEATPDLSIDDLGGEELAEEVLPDEAPESADEDGMEEAAPPVRVADRGGRFSGDVDPLEEEPNRAALLEEERADAPGEPSETDPESDEPIVAPWRRNQEKNSPAAPRSEAEVPADETPLEETPAEEPEAPLLEEEPLPMETGEASADASAEIQVAPRQTPELTPADFDDAWTQMEQEIEAGKLKEALATISPFYFATELTAEDQKQLLEVLDLLAWRVIFSKEHFLAKPHVVAPGETLEDIAQRYRVPAEVIAKINGVKSAKLLTAGMELKVVPGPFRAEIAPERGELTLFLGDLYATRYAVEAGNEPPPEPGEYTVRQRSPGAVYRTRENRDIAAANPRNPYGGVFLDLGEGQCLHGSPEEEEGMELGTGCMRLRGKDAKEVYWLLSKGSKVSVVR